MTSRLSQSSQSQSGDCLFKNLLLSKKASEHDKLVALSRTTGQLHNMSMEFMLTHVEPLLKVLNDKSGAVRTTTQVLLTAINNEVDDLAVDSLLVKLLYGLQGFQTTKTKIGTLILIQDLSERQYFRNFIPKLIAPLSDMVIDYSKECSALAITLFDTIYQKIQNSDIMPLIPDLVQSMKDPSYIPATIDAIASTTFVQSVDSVTLSVIAPVLLKTFRHATQRVKRNTIIIIENMTKLVEDAYHALEFIELLLPIMDSARDTIADPEVRTTANRVYEHLLKIQTRGQTEKTVRENQFQSLLIKSKSLNIEFTHESSLKKLLNYDTFSAENVTKYLHFDEDQAEALMAHYIEISGSEDSENITDAEELCNCEFTLGYGSKVLLHKTRINLHRGFNYGLIGPNNSGKSTLMKSMATRQLESFPQELKSVYVETDILGELSHLSLVDYILNDERMSQENLTHEAIHKSLLEFGFTEEMLPMSVSTLSGGWRMKLALSRAMMQNADILLMDEPSAHLDVRNIKWLLDYIKGLTSVTCIVVSQNAKLLDECCTHILQIDGLKLHMTKGNLSSFTETHPEALCYFELKSDKYAFKFPTPRFLPGVKSAGKPLMRMDQVTFTYPGNTKPTVKDTTVQVSMSSRIGCLGPNGAGKSTSIKLLTGQLEPDEGSGKVWVHSGVKVGYIAQHAFVHIEQHMDKTPGEYIQWRYQGGEDKEDLTKVTQVMTEEDIAKLDLAITVTVDEKKIKRTIDKLTYGRRTRKKDREYEVSFKGCSADDNIWLSEDKLIKRGYIKILKQIDSKQDAAEGAYRIALTQANVETHLQNIGLSKENASFVKIKQLSNGDKVKVVIGAALWSCPHILILDEPTNNIDRDGLSALCLAIKEFTGGIIIITHDEQFCHSICKEIWVIEDSVLNVKGDPDWMTNTVKKSILTQTMEDEMTDAAGNTTKVKHPKSKLTRREIIKRKKNRARLIALGEPVSDSDSESDSD
jgi:elongation factor 3